MVLLGKHAINQYRDRTTNVNYWITVQYHGEVLTSWNRNRNRNPGFRAGIGIGMESVDFLLEIGIGTGITLLNFPGIGIGTGIKIYPESCITAPSIFTHTCYAAYDGNIN